MNEWWQRLSIREKWMIIIGGIFVVIIFAYVFIWSPLSSNVNNLQTTNTEQRQLLNWMQHANRQIQQLKAAGFTEKPASTEALLVIAEKTLAEKKLSQYLNQVQQPSDNQLVLTFKTVPFDKLIAWLEFIWRQYSINVTQISVEKTNTPGLVEAKLTLAKI